MDTPCERRGHIADLSSVKFSVHHGMVLVKCADCDAWGHLEGDVTWFGQERDIDEGTASHG